MLAQAFGLGELGEELPGCFACDDFSPSNVGLCDWRATASASPRPSRRLRLRAPHFTGLRPGMAAHGRLKFRPPVPLKVVMRRYPLSLSRIFKPHVEGQIFLRDLQLSPAHALTSRSLELEPAAVLASWSDVDLNASNVGPCVLIPSIRDRALLRPIVSLGRWRRLRNAYGVRSQTDGIARQKRWFRPNGRRRRLMQSSEQKLILLLVARIVR